MSQLFIFSFLVLFLVFSLLLLLGFIFRVPGLPGFFSSQCRCSGRSGIFLLRLLLLLIVGFLLLLNYATN